MLRLRYGPNCNTLQHTAAYCNTLQHTSTHCSTLQHTCSSVWSMLRLRCRSARGASSSYTCVTHDSFIRVTWLIHMCDTTHQGLHVVLARHTSVCDMTYSYVWHDPSTCVTYLIHVRDMTHSHTSPGGASSSFSCVWHDSFIRVTWLIHTCDTIHSYMWHDSFTCEIRLIIRVIWLTKARRCHFSVQQPCVSVCVCARVCVCVCVCACADA